MQQGFLQSRAQILRRSVRDPVCVPCRVFVFLVLFSLHVFRVTVYFSMCVDSVGSAVIPCRCGRVSSEASISERDASKSRYTVVLQGLGFSCAGARGSVG